jgi:hypothetical protein
MISDILTEEELCPITGHWTREGLRAWLQAHNITYLIARSGWPRVHRKALERAMGVVEQIEVKEAANVEFNFGALK